MGDLRSLLPRVVRSSAYTVSRGNVVSANSAARNRFALRLTSVLILLGLALGFVSQPVPADAAPLQGRLCRDVFGLPNSSPRSSLPTADDFAELAEVALEYANPAEPVRNTRLPSDDPQEVLERYGKNYKAKDRATKKPKFAVGSEEHLFKRWNAYWAKNPGQLADYSSAFEQWRSLYVGVHDNNARGHAFHKLVVESLGLTGDDWLCEVRVGKQPNRVRVDIVHRPTGTAFEVKAGTGHTSGQLRNYQVNVGNGNLSRTVYVHPQRPDPGTTRALQRAGVESRIVPARPRMTNQVATRGVTTPFAPNRSQGSMGVVDDLARQSGRNAAEARRGVQMRNGLGGADQAFRRPGGIDWSTLELEYVSMAPGRQGVNYAFDAAVNPDEAANPSYGGKAAIHLTSDAFFTWLALRDQTFWVNLNPDQPDKIMDPKLARTDAGRVLLEADYEMKVMYTELLDPETPAGGRFWDSLTKNPDGSVCWPSGRQWITAKRATVRQERGELYILDAPLDVNMERMDFVNLPEETQCAADEEVLDHNFRMLVKHFNPVIEKAVNTAPVFAELRHVYRARIAAAWVKQRSRVQAGPYDDIINSGDVSRWPSRTKWSARKIYNQFLEDWNTVQRTVEREEVVDGRPVTWEYKIYGGVEWDESPRHRMGAARFRRHHRQLPKTVHDSRAQTVNYGDAGVYLGGSAVIPARAPAPAPAPTPEPTPVPDPSDDSNPSTPAQQPPSPPPDRTNLAAEPSRSGGSLADTGGPSALIGLLGFVITALGIGLLVRRRHG